jgi:glucose/arabinose dehydrogenase
VKRGTDPTRADTDGDGVADGADPDPLHAPLQNPPVNPIPPDNGPAPLPDTTPPDTAIDSAAHGATTDSTPTFLFHSTEEGSSFECSLDSGTPAFGPCSGPGASHTPGPLGVGSYSFRVRAVDAFGNADQTPAVEAFSVAVYNCNSPGPMVAGTGLTATFEGLENVIGEGRARIGHAAYGGGGLVEICLFRKKFGEADSTYQAVRTTTSAAAGTLIDGQRPEKGTEYVYRLDVITGSGRVVGANTVVARGAASVASVAGWAQLEENCTQCGSSSVQAGSLRSSVLSEGSGPGDHVGEVAVYKDRIALTYRPGEATLATTRVLTPLPPSTPGTAISAQLNLSVEHPATIRDPGEGTAVDLRDSALPWISVGVRTSASGTIKVVARDSASATFENVIAESPDLTAEGLQNVFITIQLSAAGRYEVRYKPNTQEPDVDVVLDLAPGSPSVTDRALPGAMPEPWLSLANEMSRDEVATHDVRFDLVEAVYQTDYREAPVESFGGAATNVQVPAGFNAEAVAAEVHSPTAIDFTDSGDMYVALRDGKVMRLDHEFGEAPFATAAQADMDEVLDIENLVNSGPNDHGLTGLVLDPGFESNGFFYAYYTVQKADTFEDRTVARVTRYHVGAGGTVELSDPLNKTIVGADAPAPDTGDPSTNDTCPPSPTSDCLPSDHYTHSSGGMKFGSDGKLWLSTPDGATPDGIEANGTDFLSLRAINPDSLAGKILRVDPATGEGVPGNPEYATESNKMSPRARTWAMGFRNPFRIAERPGSPGSWYATDVGWGAWEEVDVIPGTATAGTVPNFGWPCYEGTPDSPYKTLYPGECSFPDPIAPLWEYDSSGVDHAAIGSAFYTGNAYPTPWKPGSGEAAFYYGDYPDGDITMVKTDSNDQIVEPDGVQTFAKGFTSPVMVTEGPVARTDPGGDRALYLVDLGPFDEPAGKIWRFTYNGP